MSEKIQAIRGMNDIVPPQSAAWQVLETKLKQILRTYGYDEIRLPIVEKTLVFKRSIGDTTDIVQKEMYTFQDRNGDSLTLRPEGTAGCVRAALQQGLLQHLPQRLWYMGPMFRHERPQRGRQRQFHQIGVEAFGAPGPDIDAEMILMSARMWEAVGLRDIELQINSLGTRQSRTRYREALTDYFHAHESALDDESRKRLQHNPLRILDSKNPGLRPVIDAAPKLLDHLDEDSQAHLEQVCKYLRAHGVEFTLNPQLVRGLDYYSRTVFEWVTTALGAQGTVCAGGRYDSLVEIMGGKSLPAIGFALGLERLLELAAEEGMAPVDDAAEVYVFATDDELEGDAMQLCEELRDGADHWRVLLHVGGGSMKSRMKKADRSGARLALILGPDEHARKAVTIKPLRRDASQEMVPRSTLQHELKRMLDA